MKQYYNLRHPVLPFYVRFYFGFTRTELNKEGWEIPHNAGGFTWKSDGIVRIWIHRSRLGHIGTYVHELYHACHFMFEACGVSDYNETMAYNLEYLIEQYLYALGEFRKREKKRLSKTKK